MSLTIEKIHPNIGALVTGANADYLTEDEGVPSWVLENLETYGVLVFRGLHLDDEAQIAFSERLGQIEKLGSGDHPEIFRVSLDPNVNALASYLRGTFYWHIDGCTDDIPIMATMLSAHAVAGTGGDTEFASTYQAYENLSDDEKTRLEAMRIVHTIEASMRLHVDDPTPEQIAAWRQRPQKEHPLVWTHESGRKSLVLGATTDHVAGMEKTASRIFLDETLARATTPNRVYRHQWEVGDLVIWDNRGVLHRATPYGATSSRDMHRTTFAGDEPIK
jgi:alpha-ketoglutarate-dependent taurine dioxygenase